MKELIFIAVYIAMIFVVALSIIKDKKLKEFLEIENFNDNPITKLSISLASIFWPLPVLLWLVVAFVKLISKKKNVDESMD